MPYSPHSRIVLHGDFYATSTSLDTWSVSLAVTPEGWGTGETLFTDAKVDAAWAACDAFFQSAGAKATTNMRLVGMKLNRIGADGRYVDDTTVERLHGSPLPGTTSTQGLPYSHALRVTLDNGTRNRRRKGGFYWPALGFSVGVGGRIDAALVGGLADATQTLVNSLRVEQIVPVIASSFGDLHPISRIRVGSAPDTVRRRDNALPELYVERSVT